MAYDHIQVEPLARAIGAEIGGVDLAAPITDQAFAEMRHAFGEYGVLLTACWVHMGPPFTARPSSR